MKLVPGGFLLTASLLARVSALLLGAGCVTGRESRPPRAEAAQGAPAPLEESAPAVVPPGKRWVAGYWRWDGVRYVWIPGRFESEGAEYLR